MRMPLVLLLLSACTPLSGPRPATRPPKPASRSYHVIDATPAFWTFWQAHAANPPQVQAAAFRRMVVGAHPELFTPDVIGVDPSLRGSDLEQRLGPYLASLPARIPAMRSVHARLAQQLGQYDRSFRTLFPDMRWSGTVYVTISVDAFDGSVRLVQDKLCLLFGIDKIVKVHGGSGDLGPFFHHELFHVYHHGMNPPPPMTEAGPHGLLQPLWREGLAVYVSHLLHPAASATELLLTREMVRDGPAEPDELGNGAGPRCPLRDEVSHVVCEAPGDVPPLSPAEEQIPVLRLLRVDQQQLQLRRDLRQHRGPELAQVVAHALSELQRPGHAPTVP